MCSSSRGCRSKGLSLRYSIPMQRWRLARQYASILRSSSELSGAPSTVERAVPYAEIATLRLVIENHFLSILTLSPAEKRD